MYIIHAKYLYLRQNIQKKHISDPVGKCFHGLLIVEQQNEKALQKFNSITLSNCNIALLFYSLFFACQNATMLIKTFEMFMSLPVFADT